MNIKSSRAEATDRTGGGLQDPGETFKPILKASILFHLFRAGENCSS